MPTDTFLNLPDEKQRKIIIAAKNEFSRVNFTEASISKIIQEAEIPRGSFYQYFKDKEDLLEYLLSNYLQEINNNIKRIFEEGNKDIFEIFTDLYDYLSDECIIAREKHFFRKMFENIRTMENDLVSIKMQKYRPKNMMEYYKKIDKTNLNIESEEDFNIILKILHSITKIAIMSNLTSESKEENKQVYLKQLEYIKYGVLKNKEGEE